MTQQLISYLSIFKQRQDALSMRLQVLEEEESRESARDADLAQQLDALLAEINGSLEPSPEPTAV